MASLNPSVKIFQPPLCSIFNMEQSRTALAGQLVNGTVTKQMGLDRALVWRIAD